MSDVFPTSSSRKAIGGGSAAASACGRAFGPCPCPCPCPCRGEQPAQDVSYRLQIIRWDPPQERVDFSEGTDDISGTTLRGVPASGRVPGHLWWQLLAANLERIRQGSLRWPPSAQ